LNKVFFEWGRRLVLRASLIQVLALGLVALLDGAERAAVGAWSGWLPELFILHLHGLGFYFVLATLWLDRDWRLGGERQALAVAGRSGRELVLVTVVLGGVWASLWGGSGVLLQSAMLEEAPRWLQTPGSLEADFHGGGTLADLSIRLEGAKLVEVVALEPAGVTGRWADDVAGRWSGAIGPMDEALVVASHQRSGPLVLALCVLLGQGVLVGAAGGLCLWAGARTAWLAVLGIALVGLLSMGINSAVMRGYWGPGALVLLPLLVSLLLVISWPRDLRIAYSRSST
jgi:hypothetical protein